jgi:RNA polymerase sigma-70 factor, ECF subfamily
MLGRILEATVRREHGRILAALLRRCQNFDLAEEALQDAYLKAQEHWPSTGIPENTGAWLMTVARHRLIDLQRKQRQLTDLAEVQELAAEQASAAEDTENHVFFEDDLLRLIFTCCHPALAPASAIALTLHSVCGLRTEEIARAFFEPLATCAQKIVRAKRKIADTKIPFKIPEKHELPERLAQVLASVYLIFNEGFALVTQASARREILSLQALRLGRTLHQLLPKNSECLGLLALMLLHHARRNSRIDGSGVLITLEQQDRSLWDQAMIAEGSALLAKALAARQPGPYQIQAAIAALHAAAKHPEATDWAQIFQLYLALLRLNPTPVIELNAAVALAMSAGPAQGLAWIDRIAASGALNDYYLLHAARADLLRRAGDFLAATTAYREAIKLTAQASEREYLARRLAEVQSLDHQD